MPWVNERFGVDQGRRVYFGHSLGGLFGAYVLLREPSTFTDYILGSPSLWWDRGVVFELERDQATSREDVAAKVFLGIGAHETNEGRQREAVNMSPEERAVTAAELVGCRASRWSTRSSTRSSM